MDVWLSFTVSVFLLTDILLVAVYRTVAFTRRGNICLLQFHLHSGVIVFEVTLSYNKYILCTWKTAGTRHLGMATQWSTRMLEAHPWQRLAEAQCAGWSRRLASDVPASSTFFRPFLQLHFFRIKPSCLQIKVFVMHDTVLLSTITLQLTLCIFKCSVGFTKASYS